MTLATWSALRRERAAAGRDLPRVWLALTFAALMGGIMLPVLIFRVPFMADYPNDLARMYAVAVLDHDGLLAR